MYWEKISVLTSVLFIIIIIIITILKDRISTHSSWEEEGREEERKS